MKSKLIFAALFACLFSACTQTPTYQVTATIEGWNEGTVYLKQRVAGEWVTADSSQITDGSWKMSGTVETPDLYYLIHNENYRNALPFFLENGSITISGDAEKIQESIVTGSKTQDVYKGIQLKSDSLNNQMRILYGKYKTALAEEDSLTANAMEKELESLNDTQETLFKDFVINNPASYVAPVFLRQIHYGMDSEELEKFLSSFSAEVQKTVTAKSLLERLNLMKTVAVGQQAPDFTMNDQDGNPISLASILNNQEYLLIDFWASWCSPCRAENPNVVSVWKDYHERGFDVFGVSLDSNKEAWLKAIEKDQLTWKHVSDLKGWKNEAAKQYAVNSIPANLLVDKTGKIIAKNLREEALREKIAELLD